MLMKVVLFLLICCFYRGICQQQKTFKVRTISFYNVENLFDTVNDSLVLDDERTPNGNYQWTKERYLKKISCLPMHGSIYHKIDKHL